MFNVSDLALDCALEDHALSNGGAQHAGSGNLANPHVVNIEWRVAFFSHNAQAGLRSGV